MIEIMQTCDGCGVGRGLNSMSEAWNGGWRGLDVQPTGGSKWLCPSCVKLASNGAFKTQASE